MILMNFATTIKGASDIQDHKNWIVVDSLQFGVGRSISSVGGGSDRETSNPSFAEVACSKSTDIASADLYFQAIAGKSLGKCEIHFLQTHGTDGKGQVYLKIELEDAIISSYSTSSGGERPSESFSINFTKISYQYNAYDGDKVTTGTPKKWDVEKNQAY